jgi:RNaseH domain of pPIWI_RE
MSVNCERERSGRVARWLSGLLRGGAPRRTRTYNPRIKSQRQWWANTDHPQACAWRGVGFEVERVYLDRRRVRFTRRVAGVAVATRPADPGDGPPVREFGNGPGLVERVDVPVVLVWQPTGRVVLDTAGKLLFPRVDAAPGMYRLSLAGTGGTAGRVYVGETDNLSDSPATTAIPVRPSRPASASTPCSGTTSLAAAQTSLPSPPPLSFTLRAGLAALKKAFARTDRRLQCLRPAKLFKPPAKPWTSTKKAPPAPYPGTNFTKGSIYRASAAINNALRQLGRLGAYRAPAGLPDLEQVGIWLHHDGSTCIPIVIRLTPDGTATAHLAATNRGPTTPIPYRDLPKALADGKGRIRAGDNQKTAVSQFLINALGVGDTVSHDTHDRVVYVRSGSFRNWGWDWLQDKHIRPDHLVLPGVDLDNPHQETRVFTPQECPGLRIIRVRDRSSTGRSATVAASCSGLGRGGRVLIWVASAAWASASSASLASQRASRPRATRRFSGSQAVKARSARSAW